mmetsp:Transcript_10721/g.33063  ORF Transcript_10721/g.33063 Transcript_10721/m.33063 type:complete len:283 (-) Transcript_10721:201-1049(-)
MRQVEPGRRAHLRIRRDRRPRDSALDVRYVLRLHAQRLPRVRGEAGGEGALPPAGVPRGATEAGRARHRRRHALRHVVPLDGGRGAARAQLHTYGRSRRVLRVPGPHGGPCAPQHQAGARAGRRSRARRRALRGDTEPVFSSDGLARGAEDGSEPERGPVPQGKGAGRGLDHARHAPLPRDDAVRVRVRRTPGQGRLPGPPPVGRHSPERRDEALLGVVHGKTRARLLLDQRRDARRARVGHGVGRLLHEPPRRGRRRRLLDVTRRRRPQASVRSNPRVEVR